MDEVVRIPRAGYGKNVVNRDINLKAPEKAGHRLAMEQEYHLRCFVRDEFVEVYLDNEWVLTGVFSDAYKSGNVELLAQGGKAGFSSLRITAIEPLG